MNAVTKDESTTTVHEVDARRYNCPYPTLQLRIAMNQSGARTGDTFLVLAEDPTAPEEIELLCKQLPGYTFLRTEDAEESGKYGIKIRFQKIYIKKTG